MVASRESLPWKRRELSRWARGSFVSGIARGGSRAGGSWAGLPDWLGAWLQRYLNEHPDWLDLSPAGFLYWVFSHPELPGWGRPVVAQLLGLELVRQERLLRREQLQQFFAHWQASRHGLGAALGAARMVPNPVVVHLGWEEPQRWAVGQRGFHHWLFFPRPGGVVALRPVPGLVEVLRVVLESGRQGVALALWERSCRKLGFHPPRVLEELIEVGLIALVFRSLPGRN